VVQEVTGEPVHQLGFRSPETAKGFEQQLASLDLDWEDPALGGDAGIRQRIMRWRTTWLFLCLDGPRPYHRPHGLRLVS
jgi:hypothetical protein